MPHRNRSVLEVVVTTSPGKTRYLEETVRSFTDQGVIPEVYVHSKLYLDAWNEVLERATGKYLCLAHHDDVYWPNFCRDTVAYLEEHPQAAAVFTLDYFIDERGRPTGSTPMALPEKGLYDFNEVFKAIVKYRNVLRHETMVLRTDAVRHLRFRPDYYPADDKDFHLRILAEAGPVGVIPRPLVWYRVHNASVSDRIKRNKDWCTRWVGSVRYWGEKRPEAVTEDIRFLYQSLLQIRSDVERDTNNRKE